MATTKGTTGVVHMCGELTNEKVKIIDILLGLKIHDICGGGDKLLALADPGVYDILNASISSTGDLKSLMFEQLSVDAMRIGKNHYVALSPSGIMFSWGQGSAGELGHGIKHIDIKSPTPLRFNEQVKCISTGDYHSCAVDIKGNAYAWGQNFDKQLGLYRKPKSQMHPGCSIEGVMMVPKFLAFSLTRSVHVMACGSRFTAAIAKDGTLWTWGAGECGQLGTGRCTSREEPMICPCEGSPGGKPSFMIAVACGNAHIIAASKEGELFSWGLNSKGQLGVGDIQARHTPTLTPTIGITKVFASGHSSAAIDRDGALFTWGSNIHGHLMQENNENYIVYPSVVTKLSEDIVYSFAFSNGNAAALVHTRLLAIIPDRCPQKSISSFKLHGCGYFNSERTIVKFMRLGHIGFQAPRSSVGTLVDYGDIVCKPPKFGDPGIYEVSVALNGNDFTIDKVRILVYADPILGAFSPLMVDMRKCEGPVQIILNGTSLDTLGEDVPFKVRFSIHGTAPAAFSSRFVDAAASLIPLQPEDEEQEQDREQDDEDDGHGFDMEDDDDDHTESNEPQPIERKLLCDVSLGAIWDAEENEVGSQGGQNEPLSFCLLQAQLSLNDNDLSKPSTSQLICHRFTPQKIEPICINYERGGKLQVHGIGFFASKAFTIQAHITETSSGTRLTVDCTYVSLNVMTFEAPPLNKLLKRNVDPDEPCQVYSIDVKFSCLPVPVTDERIERVQLHPGSIPFYYYCKPRVSVSPKAIRRAGGTTLTLRLKDTDGFPFFTPKVGVVLSQQSVIPLQPEIINAEMVSILSSSAVEATEEGASHSPRLSLELSETGSFRGSISEDDANSLMSGKSGRLDMGSGISQAIAGRVDMYDILFTCPPLTLSEDILKGIMAAAGTSPDATSSGSLSSPPPQLKAVEKGKSRRPSINSSTHSTQGAREHLPKEVFIGVMLEGEAPPSLEFLTAVTIFDRVIVKDAQPPKGGYVLGATAVLNVEGLLACDGCVVRIRGTNEAFIDVEGVVACNEAGAGTITFQIPTSFTGIDAEVKSRISNFYIDISVDGKQSYDRSDNPILPVKIH